MTVSSALDRKTFTGDDLTVAFATTPVVFFDETDLQVYVITTATGVATLQSLTTDYTVTGGAGSTGTVTMLTAPASTEQLLIKRVVPITQAVDLVNNDASDAETMEDSLDKLTMIAQQLSAGSVDGGYPLRISDAETPTDALTVLPFDRASKLLGFNSAKELIVYDPADGANDSASVTFIQDGAGMVARTSQAKMRERRDMRDTGVLTSDSVATQTAKLQAALDALSSGDILHIDESYTITGLTITNKTKIKIRGAGTITLSGAASSAFIFKLVGTIDDLEIEGLSLVGEGNAAYTQQGIGNASGQTISNVWFCRNKFSNLNSGISLNAETTGSYTKAHVLDNNILNSVGTSAGQGYGIHVNTATASEIRGNVIDNASRTSILHVAQDCGNIIAGNIVVNHRQTAHTGAVAQAIQVMRSSKLRVSGNVIKDCYDGGMLVQHVTSGSENCLDIDVIGNSFINRKNLVSHLYVGESAVPGTYETTHIRIKGNTFISDAATAAGGDVTIYNGRSIEFSQNSMKKTGIAAAASFVIWGDSGAITDAADFTNCYASGNKFVAEGSDLTDVRAFDFPGDVSTGTSVHRFDNREFVGVSYPYRHTVATPTNPNLMVISDHRACVVGTGAQVGAGTTAGKARTNAAVRISYSGLNASAGSTDNLWDLTGVSTGVGEFRKVLLVLQDAASPLIVVGEVAASQAAAKLPGLPDHRWAALGIVEIPASYSGGALGAMTFYDITGIYEP